jgi:hypothetical protein
MQNIIANLPNLKKSELRAIKVACEELMGPAVLPFDLDLFRAVMDALGMKSISPNNFNKSNAYSTWINNQPVVEEFVAKIVGDNKNHVVNLHLKRFLIGLLIDHMRANKALLTMLSVAQNLSTIPQVFEKQFPGYVANNLGHLIIKAL